MSEVIQYKQAVNSKNTMKKYLYYIEMISRPKSYLLQLNNHKHKKIYIKLKNHKN